MAKKDQAQNAAEAATAEPANPASAPAALTYVETEERVIEKAGELVKVTLGKRFEMRHVEEPPQSGLWRDEAVAVWDELNSEPIPAPKPSGDAPAAAEPKG